MWRTTFDPYLLQSNHSSNDCAAPDIVVHQCPKKQKSKFCYVTLTTGSYMLYVSPNISPKAITAAMIARVASDIIVHKCRLRLWFVRNMPQKYPKLGRDWRLKVVLFVESRANCVKWLVEVVKQECHAFHPR